MRRTQQQFIKRASVIAVRAALAVLAAVPMASFAADASEEVLALTRPSSKIEIGINNVSKDSAKFGEYNGLYGEGSHVVGNADVRGGDGDSGAFRWRVTGNDLGLNSRNIGVEVGTQGSYRFNFGYDQLRREYTDSFQTLYNGTGGTALTLPAAYPAAASRTSTTGLANWNNPQSPYATAACATTGGVPSVACRGPGYLIPALMHSPGDIETERKRTDLGFSYLFNKEWEFKASLRNETKEGTKLTGFGINGAGRGIILPEPVDSQTKQFEAGLSYVGSKGYMNVNYVNSIYTNNINRWTAENPFANNSTLNNILQLSGAPDNEMRQLNLSGGFSFAPRTKLVLAGSYSQLTQNEAYNASYPQANFLIPQTSTNAKVVNTSFLARLTTRPLTDLSMNAAYKFDNRDNQTPSNLFVVPSADNGSLVAAPRTFVNEPFNRRNQRFNFDLDYALNSTDNIGAGYEWQEIAYTSHTEIPMASSGNRENTFHLDYRKGMAERLNGQLGYSHSERRMRDSYQEGNPLPLSPVIPEDVAELIAAGKVSVAIVGGVPVYTQVSPYSFPAADPLMSGFRQFFLADRSRDKLRGSLNYQATDSIVLDSVLEFSKDRFNNSAYGLKSSENWNLTLEGSYAASDSLSFTAYYTYENMKARMDQQAILRGIVANPQVTGASSTTLIAANTATTCVGSTLPTGTPANYWLDPCRSWGMQQADRVDTIGFGVKSKGFLQGKLDLSGDVVYSYARTPITMSGGTYTSNGTATVYYQAENLPEITSKMIELRLSGVYTLDKASSIRVSYLGRHLTSSDFQYDAYASNPTFSQAFIGTNMTSPNYDVHVLAVSYQYTFR